MTQIVKKVRKGNIKEAVRKLTLRMARKYSKWFLN